MFIKRARPRPSARAREVDDDEPTDSPLAQPSITEAASSKDGAGSVMERKKAQRKAKQLGQGTRLSFGGEGEPSDSGFKQKKSLLSQALKASTPVAAAPTSSSPSYSSEYLSELKAATPTRAPRVEEMDVDTEDLSSTAREKYASRLEQSNSIPDAAAVTAAKNKRKALLEKKRLGMDEEDDFISVGGEPHPESRLMREEDEGEDGDEGLADYTGANDRVYLGKGANKAAARRLKGEIGEMIAEVEDDESDEETREWERTLVARGGNFTQEKEKDTPKSTGYKPAPIPTIRPVPTIAAADARIAEHLERLKFTQTESGQTLQNATRELVLLEEQERDIRKQVEEVEAKREWAEGFQGWVETLGQFLEEKYPLLETIETDSAKYQRERDGKVHQRRTGDDNDDMALFLGVASKPPVEGEDMDSINNTVPNSEPRRTRRQARLDRRARRRGIVNAPDEDGWSTDSNLNSDVADEYEAAQHDLQRSVNSLLDDVKAEDFRNPEKGVAVQFAGWRSRYPEDYNGAFGGLALVQAWEFWARSEMVGWDPLRSDTPLESFKWFTGLYNYSRPRSATADDDDDMDLEPELGEEGDLATEMVSKTVVPALVKAIEGGQYDPYSAPQTRRAVDLVDVVAELTGRDSKKYQSLLKAVLGVFQTHIFQLAAEVAGAAGPTAVKAPPYNPTARSAMFRYVRRRLKLIRNLQLWRRTAPAEVQDLIARVVSVILRPVLARTWEGGGEDIAQKVLKIAGASLPANMVTFLKQGPQMR